MQSKTLEFREAVAAQAARFPPAKQSRKAPVPPRAEDLWTKQAEQVVRAAIRCDPAELCCTGHEPPLVLDVPGLNSTRLP